MKKTTLEKIVERGISFLSKIFPLKSYLYFPLLSTALFWGIRRATEWKKKILSWQVYLDPERIKTEPDKFVLKFFKKRSALKKIYEAEIKSEDKDTLREAFNRLYPILGLENPFLSSLFYDERKSNDFKKIVKEFDKRVSCAKKDIDAVKDKSRFLEGLESIGKEAASLSVDLMSNEEVQEVVAGEIKKWMKEGN